MKATMWEEPQPLFMDVHNAIPAEADAAAVADAHAADLRIQGKYGAQYINYWLDTDQRKIICFVDAPDADAAHAVHREDHGLVADEIYEVHQGEPHGAADGVDAR